jgi:hypothetical protein
LDKNGKLLQIISPEQFDRVQRMMQAVKIRRVGRPPKDRYPLHGMIYCGKPDCGKRYLGVTHKYCDTYAEYYRCPTPCAARRLSRPAATATATCAAT